MLYTINDLLSVETDLDAPIPSYYAAGDAAGEADVVFEAGDLPAFTHETPTRRIGSRYRWEPERSTLYLSWNLPLDLRCSIRGLGDTDRRTVVRMTEQYRKRGEIGSLFVSVLSVELLARDATIVHGGCASRPDGGALISGWDDMGKTSTCLSVHDRDGFSFMGDDAVIVGADGRAHAWDRMVGISPYTATGNLPMPEKKRGRILLKRLARAVPGLGVLHSTRERIDVTDVIADARTVCHPETVFFLEGGDDGPGEISPAEASRRLVETSTADKELVTHDAVQTYGYLDPQVSGVVDRRRRIVETALAGMHAVELRSEEKSRYPGWIVENYPAP